MYSYHSQSRSRGTSFGKRPKGHQTSKKGATKQFIHPSKFVRKATASSVATYRPMFSFQDFAIAPLLKANIEAKGFTDPSPIQDQTIPLALQGKDIIGVANTGTGKTAAFALPILHQLITNRRQKAIIIAPTRELAQQIEQDFRSIGKGSDLTGALLIGGKPISPQARDLSYKPQIVVGTPGRIKDHMERGSLNLQDFSLVVLDEVDRMLDMGFIHSIRHILGQLPISRQSLFFSAMLDMRVEQLIGEFANDPITISVKTSDSSESVDQDVITYITKTERIDRLHDILTQSEVGKTIVFDETQRSVERLSKELVSRGFLADAIHGGKTQGQRQRALDRFKANQIKILVATDVAARGIDVSDITHVINYSLPQSYEDYVHRIGRAGRAGRTGQALTFVAR